MADEWYFSRGSERQGPVSLETLLEKRAAGELAASDLVWRAGMAQWAAASTLAELGFESDQPIPQAIAQPQFQPQSIVPLGTVGYSQPHHGESIICTPRTIDLLRQTRPWARFIAILIFISSGFLLLSGGTAMLSVFFIPRGNAEPLFIGFFYLAFAALYIGPAIYLNRYCSRITQVILYRREDMLEQAIEAQKSFWKFCGMMVLVSILFFAVFFVGMIAFFAIRH